MLQSVLRLVVNVLDWTFLIVMQGARVGRISGRYRLRHWAPDPTASS
jgi:hypothetical protein